MTAPAADDTLSRLTGASPRHLLEELARVGAALAKADRPRPEVECYLASGQVLRGRIVAVLEDRNGAIALLHTAGHARTPTVAYVRTDQLTAVVVGDASLLVRAPLADAPVPSRLDLARQLQARADLLAATLGRSLPLTLAPDADDDARRAIGLALPVLAEVLTRIAEDPMGKDALVPIAAIELAAAPRLDASLAAGVITIRAPTLITDAVTHATLRAAIERLL